MRRQTKRVLLRGQTGVVRRSPNGHQSLRIHSTSPWELTNPMRRFYRMQPGPKGLPTASVGRASHAPPARRRGQPREVCLGQRDPPRYSLCIRRPPCYPRVTTAGTRLSRNSTQKLMADTPAEAKKKAEQLRQATDVSRQRRTRNSLRAFETDEISDYLTRPIRNGYWKLVPAR